MTLLAGKRALILGVANNRSIAWGIAQKFKENGAQVALSYLNDALKKRVVPLAQEINADFTFEFDVTKDEHYENLKNLVRTHWGEFDILVHSLAFADTQDLKRSFVETSRKGFLMSLEISAYSLVRLCHSLNDLFTERSSVISLTYDGSRRIMTNYNVMGVAKAALEASSRYLANDLGKSSKKIRVNCISAGPIKTLASSAVGGFKSILTDVEEKAPLKENVTPEDVAGMALYLGSDLSKRVTAQVFHVDSGHGVMGA